MHWKERCMRHETRTSAKKRTTMWQSPLAEAVMNNILQISVHPGKLHESFESFLKFTKIDTAPRRARLLPKGLCTTPTQQAMRNYLWEMAVAKFVTMASDCEERDLIDRFRFRGTVHYDARALRHDEIANTMAATSEHYKRLLSAAKHEAANEYQNSYLAHGQPRRPKTRQQGTCSTQQ